MLKEKKLVAIFEQKKKKALIFLKYLYFQLLVTLSFKRSVICTTKLLFYGFCIGIQTSNNSYNSTVSLDGYMYL